MLCSWANMAARNCNYCISSCRCLLIKWTCWLKVTSEKCPGVRNGLVRLQLLSSAGYCKKTKNKIKELKILSKVWVSLQR